MDYVDGSDVIDDWICVCYEEVFMLEVVVCLVKVVYVCYGFKDFKFKGGVLSGDDEMVVIIVLVEVFLEVCVMLDLNGVWLLVEVICLCCDKYDVLVYVEDLCGVEGGYFGCEVMVEFCCVMGLLMVINMIVIDWC